MELAISIRTKVSHIEETYYFVIVQFLFNIMCAYSSEQTYSSYRYDMLQVSRKLREHGYGYEYRIHVEVSTKCW